MSQRTHFLQQTTYFWWRVRTSFLEYVLQARIFGTRCGTSMLCSSAARVASCVTSMRCVSMLCSNDLHRAFGTMLRLVDATHARQEWLHGRTQNFSCLRLVLGHIEVANVGCPHRRCQCHQNSIARSRQLSIYIAKACKACILPSIGGWLFRGVLCSSPVSYTHLTLPTNREV